MSVLNLKSPDAWTTTMLKGQRLCCCFFCREEVADVVVVWNGDSPDPESLGLMLLHPDCAIDLSVELIGDARNARRLLTGTPLTAGMCRSLIARGKA